MAMDKQTFIDNILGHMSLEQKVGQCITFEFCGTRVESNAYDKILNHQVGGLRITPHIYTEEPYGTRLLAGAELQRLSPYAPPKEYARVINKLQEIALSRTPAIPLHISSDQEGDFSQDYARGGLHLFPSPMGMAATADPDLVYRAYRVVARQQRAVGIRQLHTPCLDINIDPRNPEICTRSFSDDTDRCIQFGLAQLRAFRDEGIVATAKHFPGRGDSAVDVHHNTDVNRASRQRLWDMELAPYRALIAEGLPCIMSGHSIYPALDPSERPASISRRMVTDLLRKELGFTGVITTDAMGMRGVAAMVGSYGEGCAAALEAGNDLILAKCDTSKRNEVIACCLAAVKDGRVPEAELDEHVRRILGMKWDYGMFSNPFVNVDKVTKPIDDPESLATLREVSRCATVVARDRANLLPLKGDVPVLVTEQRYPIYQNKADDIWWHSNMLQEFVRTHAKTVYDKETDLEITPEQTQEVLKMAEKVDVVIAMSFFFRGNPTNCDLIRELIKRGKKVIQVAACPYDNVCVAQADALVVTFSAMPRSLEAAANIIYGKAKAGGTWPLKDFQPAK